MKQFNYMPSFWIGQMFVILRFCTGPIDMRQTLLVIYDMTPFCFAQLANLRLYQQKEVLLYLRMKSNRNSGFIESKD